ncbi:hypothetical protein MUK42_33599, partial [Musa troglodytarum]
MASSQLLEQMRGSRSRRTRSILPAGAAVWVVLRDAAGQPGFGQSLVELRQPWQFYAFDLDHSQRTPNIAEWHPNTQIELRDCNPLQHESVQHVKADRDAESVELAEDTYPDRNGAHQDNMNASEHRQPYWRNLLLEEA